MRSPQYFLSELHSIVIVKFRQKSGCGGKLNVESIYEQTKMKTDCSHFISGILLTNLESFFLSKKIIIALVVLGLICLSIRKDQKITENITTEKTVNITSAHSVAHRRVKCYREYRVHNWSRVIKIHTNKTKHECSSVFAYLSFRSMICNSVRPIYVCLLYAAQYELICWPFEVTTVLRFVRGK